MTLVLGMSRSEPGEEEEMRLQIWPQAEHSSCCVAMQEEEELEAVAVGGGSKEATEGSLGERSKALSLGLGGWRR